MKKIFIIGLTIFTWAATGIKAGILYTNCIAAHSVAGQTLPSPIAEKCSRCEQSWNLSGWNTGTMCNGNLSNF